MCASHHLLNALRISIIAVVVGSFAVGSAHAGKADNIVELLNTQYGRVCKAELSGWFSKTLKIDWTEHTVKLHAMKVLAEIGSVKETLYNDGVRYFQFPNDKGTYNIIDWETGQKTSTDERARYFFSD